MTCFQKISGDAIGNVWGYLNISDIMNLLITSTEIRSLTLEINKKVGVSVFNLLMYRNFSQLSDSLKNDILEKLFLKFPKIFYLTISKEVDIYEHHFSPTYNPLSFLNESSLAHHLIYLKLSCYLNKDNVIEMSKLINLKELDISDYFKTDNCFPHEIKNLKNIISLNCSNSLFVDLSALISISVLKKIEILNLESCQSIDSKSLSPLSSMISLTKLNLKSCPLSDSALSYLIPLSNLSDLNLSHYQESRFTDSGISHLSSLSNLKSLNLDSCKSLSDRGLSYLIPLFQLSALSLAHCGNITDQGIVHILSKLSNISYLNLDSCKLSKDSTKGLLLLPNLTFLNIERWFDRKFKTKFLEKLTNLLYLNLEGCSIDNVESISRLTNLKKLNLSYTQIYDISFVKISTCKFIYELNLIGCSCITDIGYATISKNFVNILKLEFSWNKNLSYQAIRNICTIQNLKSLRIHTVATIVDDWEEGGIEYYYDESLNISELNKLMSLEYFDIPYEFRWDNNDDSKKGLGYAKLNHSNLNISKINKNTIHLGRTK